MRRVVVDASALAALVFNEPGAEEVARRRRHGRRHGSGTPSHVGYSLRALGRSSRV